jgi:serine/threonine-protein kinase
MALAPGTNLGAYRIIEPLGKGGMAAVYKAYEAALDRYVAIKVLPGEFLHDDTFAGRFEREAKVIARLEHPNIVPIHSYGIDNGSPWMAMRLVAGGTLHALLKQRRLDADHVVRTLQGVAAALDYAHGKGVIHRDVKPQNVLLDDAERVYLADFGIARMVEGSSALTATGMISGTPQYMAPEQATGQPVDHRADIYALGIMAYEMFMGRVPFSADTPVAVLLKHVQEPLPIPSPVDVPEPLVRALLKCVAKKPEDRWSSATEFANALAMGLAEAHGMPGSSSTPATGTLGVLRATAPGMGAPVTPTLPPGTATEPPSPTGVAPRTPILVAVSGLAAVMAMAIAGLAVAYFVLRPKAPAADVASSSVPLSMPASVPATAGPAATPPLPQAEGGTGPTDRPSGEPGHLAMTFEHRLKSGTLRVWLDDRLLVSDSINGRAQRTNVTFRIGQTTPGPMADVSPGRHNVRVEVKWEDNVKSETISGDFRSGGTRRLDARIGGGRFSLAQMKKSLSLEWN